MGNPKKFIIGLAILIFITAVVFFFRLPAEVAARMEPVVAQPPDYGSDRVVVVFDERIFTLFAAMNAAGFDDEFEGIPMHPIRQEVRLLLADRSLRSRDRLKSAFSRVNDYHWVNWALSRGSAPAFARAEPKWWVTTNAAPFYEFDDVLADFYHEADIPAIQRQVGADYQAQVDYLQPLAEQSLDHITGYLRDDAVPFKQLVVIPNLLDRYYSGYGPQIGERAYVVAGPTESEGNMIGLVEHEALHSIIGPMLEQNASVVSSQQANSLYGVLKTRMPGSYGTWESALEETLIRAINQRMNNDLSMREVMLDQLENQGFLLIRPLDQALAAYEQSDIKFLDYLPTLLESLNQVELDQGQ